MIIGKNDGLTFSSEGVNELQSVTSLLVISGISFHLFEILFIYNI